jgi:hypothetical protein
MQVKENVFLKFFLHHWVENTCGDVANQVLSTCLSKSNGKELTAEQTLRFRAVVWSPPRQLHHQLACGLGGRARQKMETFFRPDKYSI